MTTKSLKTLWRYRNGIAAAWLHSLYMAIKAEKVSGLTIF